MSKITVTKEQVNAIINSSEYHDDDRQYHSHPPIVYDSTKHGWPPPDGKDPYTDVEFADRLPSHT